MMTRHERGSATGFESVAGGHLDGLGYLHTHPPGRPRCPETVTVTYRRT